MIPSVCEELYALLDYKLVTLRKTKKTKKN